VNNAKNSISSFIPIQCISYILFSTLNNHKLCNDISTLYFIVALTPLSHTLSHALSNTHTHTLTHIHTSLLLALLLVLRPVLGLARATAILPLLAAAAHLHLTHAVLLHRHTHRVLGNHILADIAMLAFLVPF
jgi:hypothetical protein